LCWHKGNLKGLGVYQWPSINLTTQLIDAQNHRRHIIQGRQFDALKVPGKGPATPIEGGHPGYTVKEMAAMIHRSVWYVYRRVRSGEYEVTSSGRITHDSYLRAMTRMAFLQKKQRRRKWVK
jgi:hypothetical protein